MRKFLLFWFLVITVLVSCNVAEQVDQRILQSRVIVEGVRDSSHVPGISLTVMKKGEIVMSEGFGFSDLESQTPVEPSTTLFRIGSVSKSVTGIGLGILMEQNRINIDSSIYHYLPDYPPKRWDFTIRQVAGHIAGIRHYRGDEFLSNVAYPNVLSGLEIFSDDSLLFEPGTRYSYSTYGWNLVSAVMEVAAEKPFLEFMQSEVFDPLGLKNLQAEDKTRNLPNLTTYYQLNGDVIEVAPEVDNSYKWAGGGFISTPEDLAIFAQKVFFENQLISESTIEQVINPMQVEGGESTNYGLGWRTGEDERGHFFIGHSGGSVGGITMLIIYPGEQIIVALLSNSSNVRYGNAYNEIAWLFMDSEKAE